jgi:hypothetical protein
MSRKARDSRIAAVIGEELTKALGPVIRPEALTEHSDVVCEVFGRVFDQHGVVTEWVAANVLKCVPRVLAKAELARRRDAAKENK